MIGIGNNRWTSLLDVHYFYFIFYFDPKFTVNCYRDYEIVAD